ncbi:hypothetical protein BT69DRAFT_1275756, partial [Atractiella rhizophila]
MHGSRLGLGRPRNREEMFEQRRVLLNSVVRKARKEGASALVKTNFVNGPDGSTVEAVAVVLVPDVDIEVPQMEDAESFDGTAPTGGYYGYGRGL